MTGFPAGIGPHESGGISSGNTDIAGQGAQHGSAARILLAHGGPGRSPAGNQGGRFLSGIGTGQIGYDLGRDLGNGFSPFGCFGLPVCLSQDVIFISIKTLGILFYESPGLGDLL